MNTLEPSDERQRLLSAASLADIVACTVGEFAPLPVAGTLTGDDGSVAVPPGWYLAAPGDNAEQPVRVAVTGHRSRGGWEGCDTLAAFSFTGIAATDVAIDHGACTLRDLGAAGVTTRILDTPVTPDACGVRSTGYFTAARLRMWGQFTTYIAGSECPGMGRLLQHNLFVVSQRRTHLRRDITYLSDTVANSFGALLDSR
ncbi:hypothetical protein [Mycobacterium riyadhense]|uniref:PknH-like extracellular domain-containing protein n=1 Tax=Mycobacterium riyadhense TaxID=486698 RepID=A0A1X2CBJ8_9MYCO|nr:hypothetical protein [Mycobacterium riyadhense]ORW73193.1 hypothetical protein AWC22_01275 [Mycobacterium riyadhense]VTO95380.1 hypothetical protein BIN_B_00858 [Mycobacterium riyadhense]